MEGPDVSRLAPSDIVAALRSLQRRFADTLAPQPGDPEGVALAEHIGPDGHTAVDHVWRTANTLLLLSRALHEAAVATEPVLHPAVTDDTLRHWDLPTGIGPDEALAHLDDAARTLAEQIDRVAFGQWDRAAHVAGGGTTTLRTIAQEAARAGALGLAATARVMASVRRQP